jgi:hypothetical protein
MTMIRGNDVVCFDGPATTVALLKALGINDVVCFDGSVGDGGPTQGAQGPVAIFAPGALDCYGELTKNKRLAADGGDADRLHGGQGDRDVRAVVLRSEEVLTITSMLSA